MRDREKELERECRYLEGENSRLRRELVDLRSQKTEPLENPTTLLGERLKNQQAGFEKRLTELEKSFADLQERVLGPSSERRPLETRVTHLEERLVHHGGLLVALRAQVPSNSRSESAGEGSDSSGVEASPTHPKESRKAETEPVGRGPHPPQDETLPPQETPREKWMRHHYPEHFR